MGKQMALSATTSVVARHRDAPACEARLELVARETENHTRPPHRRTDRMRRHEEQPFFREYFVVGDTHHFTNCGDVLGVDRETVFSPRSRDTFSLQLPRCHSRCLTSLPSSPTSLQITPSGVEMSASENAKCSRKTVFPSASVDVIPRHQSLALQTRTLRIYICLDLCVSVATCAVHLSIL